MKKILSTLCMTLIAAVMMAQAPTVTFDEERYNYGTIYKEDGDVTHDFYFTNEGMDAVTIVNVKVGCGCTTSKKTEGPIEPGQRGFVSAKYRASSQRAPQHFDKYLEVTFSSAQSEETKKYRLTFAGDLKERDAKPESTYPIALGPLGTKTKALELGSIRKGVIRVDGIEFANLSKEDHKVELFLQPSDAYIQSEVSISEVKPGEMGKFTFTLDSKAAKVWGPQEVPAYVVIDGKRHMTDDYKIVLRFNIQQDFSQMTVEEKQNAPIIETEDKIELGTVAAGKNVKFMLPVKNTGVNPLEILRVYSNGEELTLKAPKAIKSGKKGAITIDVNAKELKPGTYTRDLNIISNDYQHSIKRIKVSWIVE